jgi:hypothetical protein
VIDTATNTVIGAPIPVGLNPAAFGLFIGPAATAIPTLSEWAQIGMVALLAGGGLLALRKRSTV